MFCVTKTRGGNKKIANFIMKDVALVCMIGKKTNEDCQDEYGLFFFDGGLFYLNTTVSGEVLNVADKNKILLTKHRASSSSQIQAVDVASVTSHNAREWIHDR